MHESRKAADKAARNQSYVKHNLIEEVALVMLEVA
jgi:hypothetical protein